MKLPRWMNYDLDPGVYASALSRQICERGDAAAVSKDIHSINPQESFDGKTVYFGTGLGEVSFACAMP